VAADWRRLCNEDEFCLLTARLGDQLVGALGAEYVTEDGRAWMLGPHVAPAQWEKLAGALHAELGAALPQSLKQWEVYLNQENSRGLDYYGRAGFKRTSVAHVYHARCSQLAPTEAAGSPATPQQHGNLAALHGSSFPNAWLTAAELLERQDDSHRVLTVGTGTTMSGYVAVALEADAGQGTVEFLAVRPELRRQGLGRKLLGAGLAWLRDAGAEGITLNVRDELTDARALYNSCGFVQLYTGVALTRKGPCRDSPS
jgi:ribosomal protein S18 acetylase RimI-like enzyme